MTTEIVQQSFSFAQLDIIKKSVAPDTNQDEFNLFIETCKLYGLNPMKRQIGARVYNKDKPDKRSMAIITEIGGLRAIASRQGNYRPDEEEPKYTYNTDLKDPLINPFGIEKAVVNAYFQDNKGDWRKIAGVAYWDEFAPVEDEWAWNEQQRKRTRTGKKALGSTWAKMGRLMIAKCAEAQALRKGWPEDLGGLYENAETDRANINDISASDALEILQSDQRHQKLNGPRDGYAIVWVQDAAIEMIEAGTLIDKVDQWLRDDRVGSFEIEWFKATNKNTLQRFWADSKSDALHLNKLIENKLSELNKVA
jgi:phage recombination protein Bet